MLLKELPKILKSNKIRTYPKLEIITIKVLWKQIIPKLNLNKTIKNKLNKRKNILLEVNQINIPKFKKEQEPQNRKQKMLLTPYPERKNKSDLHDFIEN